MEKRETILVAISEAKAGMAPVADLFHILISVTLDVRELLQEQGEVMKRRESQFSEEKFDAMMKMAREAFQSIMPPAPHDARSQPLGVPGFPGYHYGFDTVGDAGGDVAGAGDVVYFPDELRDPLAFFSLVKTDGKGEVAAGAEFAALRIYLSDGFMNGARGAIANHTGPDEPTRHEVVVIHEGAGESREFMRLTFDEFLRRIFEGLNTPSPI